VIALVAIIGLFFSIFVLATSRRDKPPRYHFISVALAFGMSILWIYAIANELVDLLQAVGIMWQVSDAILATTVLAWGNSIGDMVADVIVARQGYPEMACGACYGGPCLNLLIGLGISITSHCIRGDTFQVSLEPTLILSFAFLIASLISALVVIPLCRFTSPKPFGVFLLAIYVIYMVMNILVEMNIVWK